VITAESRQEGDAMRFSLFQSLVAFLELINSLFTRLGLELCHHAALSTVRVRQAETPSELHAHAHRVGGAIRMHYKLQIRHGSQKKKKTPQVYPSRYHVAMCACLIQRSRSSSSSMHRPSTGLTSPRVSNVVA